MDKDIYEGVNKLGMAWCAGIGGTQRRHPAYREEPGDTPAKAEHNLVSLLHSPP
jgi:hypothetical protein